MPKEKMTEKQLAVYLGMDLEIIIRLASRGGIPCRKVDYRKYIFRRMEVDHWVWDQLHSFDRSALKNIEAGVISHNDLDSASPIVCPLIDEECIVVPFEARTAPAVMQGLVDAADCHGVVYDRDGLLDALRGRESLCSTSILPGVAFPHPRTPQPYSIAQSFIAVGITPSGVPFGAPDGSLTRIFFLICCKDENTHLHVLARLVRMLDRPDHVSDMISCQDATSVEDLLAHWEMGIIMRQDDHAK